MRSASRCRSQPRLLLSVLVAPVALFPLTSHSFVLPPTPLVRRASLASNWTSHAAAEGGGSRSGGGFGSKTPKPSKKPSKQAVLKKLEKTYGGTSPQEIALATQKRIDIGMKNMPPHLQMMIQRYQQLQIWNSNVSRMTLLEQANMPKAELSGAQRAQEEFDRLLREHRLTLNDLHNIFQKITWDASADAKAARAITGEMSSEVADRMNRACCLAAEPVLSAGTKGRCLDVGCGFGVLVPHLVKAGLSRSQIVGVDLSPEMIRNAKEQQHGVEFKATDFLNEFHDEDGFDSVIFCSALHDLPDTNAALEKAAGLLRPHGRLVIVHPQGASHVMKQASANPILVKRGLPDELELKSLSGLRLSLEVAPARPGSKDESEQGYLAVLAKNIGSYGEIHDKLSTDYHGN